MSSVLMVDCHMLVNSYSVAWSCVRLVCTNSPDVWPPWSCDGLQQLEFCKCMPLQALKKHTCICCHVWLWCAVICCLVTHQFGSSFVARFRCIHGIKYRCLPSASGIVKDGMLTNAQHAVVHAEDSPTVPAAGACWSPTH